MLFLLWILADLSVDSLKNKNSLCCSLEVSSLTISVCFILLIIIVNWHVVIIRWGTIPPLLKQRGFLYPYTHDLVIKTGYDPNGTKLSQMPIPLPPIAEQRRIVAEVERHLSIADVVEKNYTIDFIKRINIIEIHQ